MNIEEIIVHKESVKKRFVNGYTVHRNIFWYEDGRLFIAEKGLTFFWERLSISADLIDKIIEILTKIKKEHELFHKEIK